MLKDRGEYRCCDRCPGGTGPEGAARMVRRRLFKEAVFRPQPGPSGGSLGGPSGVDPASPDDSAGPRLPRAVAGIVLDISPHVLVIGDPDGSPATEQRFTLTPEATTWRGAAAAPTAVSHGDHVVVRLHPARRAVADRIWAGIGRVTGTIIDCTGQHIVVDEGVTRPRQIVVISPRATQKIQVRFPTLQPGFLLDVIGLRHADHLEALIPATAQPAYPAHRMPEPPLVSGHVPDSISGSATWHEPAGEPPGLLGVAYPALDPETGCVQDRATGGPRGYSRMPYLAVGSSLRVRNDCNGAACVLPVTGCASVARLFNDRCVDCGTSPRGRVADLTQASFVALGGELERSCFNATIAIGRAGPGRY